MKNFYSNPYETEINYIKHRLENDYDTENDIHESIFSVDEIADFYEEASFLVSLDLGYGEDQEFDAEFSNRCEKIAPQVAELAIYEKNLVRVRSYFIYEKILYHTYSQTSENLVGVNQYVDNLLSECISLNTGFLSKMTKYPIRNRVQKVCECFLKQLSPLYLESSNENEQAFCHNLILLRNRYFNITPDTSNSWYQKIKIMDDLLHLLHNQRLGSVGHLLWLFVYISEIIYFHTNQPTNDTDYWDNYILNSESLDALFHLFLTNRRTAEYEVEQNMIQCYNRQSALNTFSYEEEMKRIRKILYYDKQLRETFIHMKHFDNTTNGNNGTGGSGDSNGSGNNGSSPNGGKKRCYAILTNGRKRYVAISGYDTNLLNMCKAIISTVSNGKYKVIDDSEYPHTIYALNNIPTGRQISQGQTFPYLTEKKVKRMFSCAERRLVKQYLSEPNKKNFVILVKLEPCYICKRVLEKNQIPYKGFAPYHDMMLHYQNIYDQVANKIVIASSRSTSACQIPYLIKDCQNLLKQIK
ncbi:MAG: hypothetical protein ACI4ES_03275 [Roseburia sp.]